MLSLVEIKEFGVGESGKIAAEVEVLGLLRGNVVFGWDGVEIGEITRYARSPATTIARHARTGGLNEYAQSMVQLR